MSSPRDQTLAAFVRLVACTLGYMATFMLVRRAMDVGADVKDVEPVALLHGAGCVGFLAVGFFMPPSARATSARGLGRGVLTYLAFLLAWVPLAMLAYPALLRVFGVDFVPQELLGYFQTADIGRWQAIAMVTTAVIVSPLMEEVAFRGHIRDLLRGLFGPAAGLVGTSILFGLMHGFLYAAPLALLGLLFGWLRERTGGLLVAMLVHALHNTLTLGLALGLPDLFRTVMQ